ncbi:hypothetical protein [Nitrosospira sp. Is2]|uniref:hypothetical protein n=1 Tax=Nitrosospira sp. Is2 TaxID=3080532 RepID=UPI00295506AD|nr:hypothetical protein [Nitrosospira sp. Is2]WON74459.1 hypothetical protein R5L00_02915 [Nitrosospira sp. Is2]
MKPEPVTDVDIESFAKKLDQFRGTLNQKENTVLLGIMDLADKSLLKKEGAPTPKKKLTLERESIRELTIWDQLIGMNETGISLWGCPGAKLGDDVINPPRPVK